MKSKKALNLPTKKDRDFMRALIGEPTNAERAAWADKAIKAFIEDVGDSEDDENNAADLIADIFHWLNQRKLSVSDAVDRARNHFEYEVYVEAKEPKP